jgi:hypothetical protein
MRYRDALKLFNTVKDRYGFVMVREEENFIAASPSGIPPKCGAFISLIGSSFKVVHSIDLDRDQFICYSWNDFDNLDEACKHLDTIMEMYHKLLFKLKQLKLNQKLKDIENDF